MKCGKPRGRGGESIRMMNGVVCRGKCGGSRVIFASSDLLEEKARRASCDHGSGGWHP